MLYFVIGIIILLLVILVWKGNLKKFGIKIPFFEAIVEAHEKDSNETSGSKEDVVLTKESVRILFIDDNKFPIIENLKNAGYQVNWLKDIKKIEDPKVVDAHVLFVDYKGVGKNLSQNKEGIGVCKMLKDKYKESKYIVLCTGESVPNELLKEIKSVSDEIVPKSLETTDFIDIINIALKRIVL
jgi:hypothetical protein